MADVGGRHRRGVVPVEFWGPRAGMQGGPSGCAEDRVGRDRAQSCVEPVGSRADGMVSSLGVAEAKGGPAGVQWSASPSNAQRGSTIVLLLAVLAPRPSARRACSGIARACPRPAALRRQEMLSQVDVRLPAIRGGDIGAPVQGQNGTPCVGAFERSRLRGPAAMRRCSRALLYSCREACVAAPPTHRAVVGRRGALARPRFPLPTKACAQTWHTLVQVAEELTYLVMSLTHAVSWFVRKWRPCDRIKLFGMPSASLGCRRIACSGWGSSDRGQHWERDGGRGAHSTTRVAASNGAC